MQAQLRNDASSASTVDDCIQLWTKVLIADSARADRVADNVTAMQRESLAMLELLAQYLDALGHIPPSPSLDPRPRRGAERERAFALDSASSHPRHAPARARAPDPSRCLSPSLGLGPTGPAPGQWHSES